MKELQSMHSMNKSDNKNAITSEELIKKAAGSVEAERRVSSSKFGTGDYIYVFNSELLLKKCQNRAIGKE